MYCPHIPYPKQQLFLDLDCKEALYGGAAGGGKSDSLLMAALQYVHVPKYSALILRKDSQRLRLSGGLIPRSHEWLTGKATWNGQDKRWTFPSGASIQFGYLDSSDDKYRYGSSEYQFIGFDELTEFLEDDYTFLFSRLRKTIDIFVPYRIRGASNPGGKGHDWCKARFVSPEAEYDLKMNALKNVYWKQGKPERIAFVPAKVRDNPAVNTEEYVANLMHLAPVVRERLMNGDWTIIPTGLIKEEWLRYYTMRHNMIDLLVSTKDAEGNVIHSQEVMKSFHENICRRFVTGDTAGGMADIVKESKGKSHSWSVFGVWDYKAWGKSRALILRHVVRLRAGFVEICNTLRRINEEWQPSRIRIEDATMGPHLFDALRGEMPIDCISTEGKDKVTRAAPLMNMFSRGEVYLPQEENSWRPVFESELLSWLGLEDETNDQVDMSAYAAIEAVGHMGTGTIKLPIDPRKNPVTAPAGRMGSGYWS